MATKSLGVLTLDLIAKIGGFEQGMDKAARISEKRLKQIATQASAVGNTIGTYLTRGIDFATKSFASLLAQGANFQDIAEKIGDTAEAVASLKAASDQSATSFDTIAAASVKLSSALAKTDDESKGVGKALEAIGLNIKDFEKLSPVDQIEAIAKALNGFADGANKTAVAVALFGKSGAELLPFLNDLADGAERQISLTQEQIDASNELAENLNALKGQVNTLGTQYAAQLIPVFSDFLQVSKEVSAEVFGLGRATSDLALKNEIREWAQNGVIALAVLGESLVAVGKLARALAGSFQAVAADAKLAFDIIKIAGAGALGGPVGILASIGLSDQKQAELKAALDDRNKTVEEANKRYRDLWDYNGTQLSDALRKQFDSTKTYVDKTKGLVENAIGLNRDLNASIPFRNPSLDPANQQIPFALGRNANSPAPPKPDIVYSAVAEGAKKAKKEVDEFAKAQAAAFESIQSLNDNLTQQLETMGMSEAQTIRYRIETGDLAQQFLQAGAAALPYRDSLIELTEQLERREALSEESKAAIAAEADAMAEAKKVIEDTMPLSQKYSRIIEDLNKLYQEGRLTVEQYNIAVHATQDEFEEASKAANKATDEMSEFAEEAARNMQDAFAEFLFDPFDKGLKGMLDSFEETLRRMAANQLAAQLLGGFTGGGGSGGGGFDWRGLLGSAVSAIGGYFGGSTAGTAAVTSNTGGIDIGAKSMSSLMPGQMIAPDLSGMAAKSWGGAQNINITVPITAPQGTVAPSTRTQIAAQVAREVARANSRNN